MDIELLEIREFLAEHPPFDALPEDILDRLPRELAVRYLRRGSAFPPQDVSESFLYLVRSGAVEFRDAQGELIGKIAEGDSWSDQCAPEYNAASADKAITVEDSLVYVLPCRRVQQLRQLFPNFDQHFNDSLRERLQHARETLQDSCTSGFGLMTVGVSRLVNRTPVQVGPEITLQAAAQLMTRERISALLVSEERRLLGIVTDRDLRRCVAEGRRFDEPVSAIMSRNLHKISKDATAFEALISMTRLNVHHLPVMDRDGVYGLISTSDVVRYQSANAIFLVGDVRVCDSVEALAQVAKQLPELQVQIVASGASAYHLGQAVTSVTDAITVRLLELAEARLGPPPVPYAWLAGGSQARREQTVHSDQDNALLLSDEVQPEHDAYFEALANFVNDGLAACGFIYCPGDVMARNPKWRQPYRVWRAYFDEWIARANRKSVMLAVNFFDTRVIHGDEMLHARLHAEAVRQAGANSIFLTYLAAHALTSRPPLGFFRHLVLIAGGEHAKSLDLKHGAIIPITDLARLQALAAGLPEINTIERLRATAEIRAISSEGAANLEDAYEFIATLRARHQARQIKKGERPDNYVKPAELSALERNHLKDVFSVISRMQSTIAQRYQTERLF
jgi:CBS domain-containing protein